jgi:hypothetical protein
MIFVAVYLLPGGSEELRRGIAAMAISNMSNLAERSDYRVKLFEAANPIGKTAERSSVVMIHDHDRRESVWSLIEKAIRKGSNPRSSDRDRQPTDRDDGIF